jgi:hypothetical protein
MQFLGCLWGSNIYFIKAIVRNFDNQFYSVHNF